MNNSDIAVSASFTLFHVPVILFEGISHEYGKGTEKEVKGYQTRSLDEQEVGFPGVVGLHKHSNGTIFVLWPYFSDELGGLDEPQRLLSILASEKSGATVFGEGGKVHSYHVTQTISVQIYKGDFIPLDCVANSFMRWIWQKAEELQECKNCQVAKNFWRRCI